MARQSRANGTTRFGPRWDASSRASDPSRSAASSSPRAIRTRERDVNDAARLHAVVAETTSSAQRRAAARSPHANVASVDQR